MKTKIQINERLKNLESNNKLVTNEKGHELNNVRIDELKLILVSDESKLYSNFRELSKLKGNRNASAKVGEIKWALEKNDFKNI